MSNTYGLFLKSGKHTALKSISRISGNRGCFGYSMCQSQGDFQTKSMIRGAVQHLAIDELRNVLGEEEYHDEKHH
jgi:hypothetical protein